MREKREPLPAAAEAELGACAVYVFQADYIDANRFPQAAENLGPLKTDTSAPT